ncbi:MAG: hypothetical protein GOV00_03340 [Candidatus Altiarchaeota archaeon]|nr:hypothetical protein [Candidatus Altiarchaeota archaeon]
MRKSMSVKSTKSHKGKLVKWKNKPFAAGHVARSYPYLPLSYKTFLLLIAIHTSIFILPSFPTTAVILLLALVKGWLLAG